MKRILLIGTIHKAGTLKIPNFLTPSPHCFQIREISRNLFSRMTSLLKVSRNLISRKRPKTAKINSAKINSARFNSAKINDNKVWHVCNPIYRLAIPEQTGHDPEFRKKLHFRSLAEISLLSDSSHTKTPTQSPKRK